MMGVDCVYVTLTRGGSRNFQKGGPKAPARAPKARAREEGLGGSPPQNFFEI